MITRNIGFYIKKCIAILCCICIVFPLSGKLSESTVQNDRHYVTIFVHGVVSIKQHLTIPNVVKFIQDKINNSHYSTAVCLIRQDPFFYQQQAMEKLGLQHLDINTLEKGNASALTAYLCHQIGKHAGDTRSWDYYTYGWSGLLSPCIREQEAILFYQTITNYFAPLLKSGSLYLRIIAYSHGGNVSLKLAESFGQETCPHIKNNFRINEMVMIGSPVLPETDYLTNSPLFEKIYHFYSYGDRVQRMDCFSLHRMASNRIFKDRPDFIVPQKLQQIRIAMQKSLNRCIKEATCMKEKEKLIRKKRTLRCMDPGHSELWSFGWIPNSYRKQFPLFPMPAVVLIPYFIQYLQLCANNIQHGCFTLYPDYACFELYDFWRKKGYVQNFLTKHTVAAYAQKSMAYAPCHFSKEEYNRRITCAKKIARAEWREKNNINWNYFRTSKLCDDY